ncbi:DUF1456 family protein [Thalassotalea agariperforans]
MTNNDILRRLRFSFEFNDKKMLALFALADLTVTFEQLKSWLKKDDDADFVMLTDVQFATFLNGLIYQNRGKQDGSTRPPEKRLSNNIILNKLKIALNLKAEDIIAMLAEAGFNLSKPELSAMFRKPDHKHYRECKDQLLRNFLSAIQIKYRKSPIKKTPVNNTEYKAKFENRKPENNKFDKAENSSTGKTARPQASKPYINPKATKAEDKTPKRKVLKISPDEIWKNS